MQFSVPQFTDVEDKIVGGMTFKQFAIVFGAGVFTFVIFTISNQVLVTVVVGILTGLPAIVLAFGKMNGRPLYSSAGNFFRFLLGAKIYVFHKEGQVAIDSNQEVTITEQDTDHQSLSQRGVKIKELNYVLEQQQAEQKKLLDLISQKPN
ncbi:MAG: PrgI family protein [Candidatus Doudnabacteria bacterium]